MSAAHEPRYTVGMNELLLRQADDAFFGPAWHGPAVLPTLKKLTAAEAVRTSPWEGFTPWGVVLHMAYWKHRGTQLLAKASEGLVIPPGKFFRSPADWPALPTVADGPTWNADLNALKEVHQRFAEALKRFPPDRWNTAVRSDGTTASQVAFGVAAHDLYHTAQIRNMGIKGF